MVLDSCGRRAYLWKLNIRFCQERWKLLSLFVVCLGSQIDVHPSEQLLHFGSRRPSLDFAEYLDDKFGRSTEEFLEFPTLAPRLSLHRLKEKKRQGSKFYLS